MKVYTLVFCDINHYGYGAKSVATFTDEKAAVNQMKEEYLEKCKEHKIENPLDGHKLDYQFGNNFAFILDFSYYWDIFETEI